MLTKEFAITLDMKRENSFHPFEVVEADTGNVLHILLQNDGVSMDLTGCYVCVLFASKAGFAIQDNTNGLTLGAGTGQIDVQLYAESYGTGEVTADVQVYSGEENATLITSKRFTFRCVTALMSQSIIAASAAYPPLVTATRAANDAAAAALAAAVRLDSITGEPNVQADWEEADADSDAYITNKPEAFTPISHASSHATGGADAITPATIGAAAAAHASRHAAGGADAVTPAAIGAVPASEKGAASGVAALDASGKLVPNQAYSARFNASVNHTLLLSEAGRLVCVSASTARTITIPTHAAVDFPILTEIEFCQMGTGKITFAGETGVTIHSLDGLKSTAGQYACVALKKMEENVWLLSGALG